MLSPGQAQQRLDRGKAREHARSTAERRVFWLARLRRWALVVAADVPGMVEYTEHADCPCGDDA